LELSPKRAIIPGSLSVHPADFRVFRTESLDLAAYLVTAAFEPNIVRSQTEKRTTFQFTETEELRQSIINYKSGESFPVRRLST